MVIILLNIINVVFTELVRCVIRTLPHERTRTRVAGAESIEPLSGAAWHHYFGARSTIYANKQFKSRTTGTSIHTRVSGGNVEVQVLIDDDRSQMV